MKIRIKTERLVDPIYIYDGVGTRVEIKSPVLLSIFQSPELIKEYKKDPEKKYTVKDILKIRCSELPVKEATIRRALTDNTQYFDTQKDVEIRGKRGNKTVMVINFTKLKPIAFDIFKAVEKKWKEDNE